VNRCGCAGANMPCGMSHPLGLGCCTGSCIYDATTDDYECG
jgi:hypothetical protein